MVKNIIGFRNGVINMAREFKTVHKMKAGDEEKHRYLSCKAGQEGVGGMAAVLF
ncbi:MAG: hypothetical protein J6A09_00765 [Alphaproteobacteria bacterium]|nr:hypothetical protein [Alphaproteobacteria bacterium]